MAENIFKLLIYVFVFIFGMCIFSFLNVLIYRLPKKMQFIKGRSFCPSCNHELHFYEMVPVLSYVFLKGRCRYCKDKISPRYMIVELLGGISALLSFFSFFHYEHFFEHLHITGEMWFSLLRAVFVFTMFALLTVVAFIDIDTQEISNGASLFSAVLGVLSIFILKEIPVLEHIIGFFAVSVPMLLITMVIADAFGGGDIKLMFGIGGVLGWKLALLGLFIAVVTGGIYGIFAMAAKKKGRKDHFAFGPFLCLGAVISLLWGSDILQWYFSMIYL